MGLFPDQSPKEHPGVPAAQALPAWRLGRLMLRARAQASKSVEEVASFMGVSSRQITQWESGKVPVLDRQLEEYAVALNTSVDGIVPSRARITFDPATRTLAVGANMIDVPARASNESLLRLYLDSVVSQRASTPGESIAFRREDIVALAAMLDTEDSDLEKSLQRVMNLTPEVAATVNARITRQRIMAAAAVLTIGAVGAVGHLRADPASAGTQANKTTETNIGTGVVFERNAPGGEITRSES